MNHGLTTFTMTPQNMGIDSTRSNWNYRAIRQEEYLGHIFHYEFVWLGRGLLLQPLLKAGIIKTLMRLKSD